MHKDIVIPNRLNWIDWAKSICMFLVIIGHCHISDSDQFVVQYIYSFHMPLFFFISGLLCKRDIGLLTVKKDLRFLILPYFTYGLIYIFVDVIRTKTLEFVGMQDKLFSLLIGLDAGIGPIWFLFALFFSKQLFLLIKVMKRYSFVLYMFFVIISFFLTYFISISHYNFPFFIDSAILGLPFLIVASETDRIWKSVMRQKGILRACISMCFFFISVYLCYLNGKVVIADCIIGKSIWLYFISSFLSIISLLLLCTLLDRIKWKFVSFTSYGTIVTLGVHGIFLTVFNYYLPVIMGYEAASYSLLVAFVYSTLTYVLCFVSIISFNTKFPIVFGLKGQNLATL